MRRPCCQPRRRPSGAEIAVQFGVVIPEALTAIETYTGTQIQGIGETTLRNVRAVIRSAFARAGFLRLTIGYAVPYAPSFLAKIRLA